MQPQRSLYTHPLIPLLLFIALRPDQNSRAQVLGDLLAEELTLDVSSCCLGVHFSFG